MSEKTESPTKPPINDWTIRPNRHKGITVVLGQNRIAFCYRTHMKSILDQSDDIDYLSSEGDRKQEIVDYHLEQLLNAIEGEEESVSVAIKWQNGSCRFIPRVSNDMHAVFRAGYWGSNCCISVSPYEGSRLDGHIALGLIDTEHLLFEPCDEFFGLGGSNGR